MTHDLPREYQVRPRRWIWLAAGALVAVVAATAAVVVVVFRSAQASTKITFEVFGPAGTPLTIVWRAPGDRRDESLSPSSLPWSKTVRVPAREGALYLHAIGAMPSGPADAGSSVSCRITVNGQVAEEVGPSWEANCFTTLQRVFKATAR